MKKIMIVGGGYYQLPLIKKSVELGCFTIVVGIPGNYPGYKYASKWIDVDTFNKEAVLKVAQEEQIDGIVLCGSDACMPTIGYVCDKMHLLGPSEEAAINASNKAIMKSRFIEYGVRTAAYKKIQTLDEALEFAKNHNYPVVLKVVDASGSRGVAIVKNEEKLKYEYSEVTKATKLPYVIIEEFISGEEFGAQAFVRDEELTFVMPHGDIVFHGVTDVPIGHYAPYEREDEIIDDVTEQLQLCVKALGINNTAINADFILSNGKVYVLEIGARAGATCLPELVSNYYGINYYEYLLRQCVGDFMEFVYVDKKPSWVETLISTKGGIVESVEIGEMPSETISYDIYPRKGDEVHEFKNAFDRIGTLILRGKGVSDLRRTSENIRKHIINIIIK